MPPIVASATRTVSAPSERVLAFLRDYRQARASILPDNYSRYRVEAGGEGSGTVFAYHFKSGPTERDFRMRAEESDGSLVERDELSSYVNTWTVIDTATGSTVTLESTWVGGGGIGGFFERLFAPLGMRKIFGEVLDRLAAALQGP
ncbi:MAG TPA: SRPBCC family protein [Solirubrobacteraceae bacterium]|nr:SRPBCC family protein [Solirubrobacteraceae bacterium]